PEVTATARLKYDISKQGMVPTPANATHGFGVCSFDAARYCYRATYSLLISAPVDGKGTMPAVGDVTFVDDVSAEKYLTNLTPEALAAIDADKDKYGVRISAHSSALASDPGTQIAPPNRTEENSVRRSGTMVV